MSSPFVKSWGVYDKIRHVLKLDFPLEACTAALYRIGSHSHGTYIPPEDPSGIDDVDFMLVLTPPRKRVYGLQRFDNAQVKVDNYDIIVYSWDKYVRLLLKSNPNILSTLWLDFEDIGVYGFGYSRIWRHRDAFMSRFIYTTFCGYARGQLKRMTHHACEGYMGAKRKELVQRFGYDVKNAAHLIRLLRMGSEALRTGELVVKRPDAEEIKSIKRGEWSLERVQEEAEREFSRLASERGQSKLQEYPNQKIAEAVLLQGYDDHWHAEPPLVIPEDGSVRP